MSTDLSGVSVVRSLVIAFPLLFAHFSVALLGRDTVIEMSNTSIGKGLNASVIIFQSFEH
jgi:hypothetical protein